MRLTLIVNGQHTEVVVNPRHALSVAIPAALRQTGNTGSPPENWELRNPAGTLLDTTKSIWSFQFGEKALLYLNLLPGVGG